MASSTDIIINPVGGLILGGSASIMTLLLYKYLSQNFYLQYFPQATIRFCSSILSGIFAAIFLAGRSGRTPIINDNISKVAGLDVLAIIITICIAILFGSLTGIIVRFLKGPVK